MPLLDVQLHAGREAPPREVRTFLREATRRIERFQRDHHIPAFVPCDFARTYDALRSLAESNLAPGNLFCEWGSGFGVVACLASMLEFDACGIEIEAELVDAARELADDFDLSVEFIRGSFIPPGSKGCLAPDSDYGWLNTTSDAAHEELGLAPDDFDVIFAYPWPDEERLTAALFEQYGREGAVLMTYEEVGGLRLRQKAAAGRRGVGRFRRHGARGKPNKIPFGDLP
jgi:hypothetical protein